MKLISIICKKIVLLSFVFLSFSFASKDINKGKIVADNSASLEFKERVNSIYSRLDSNHFDLPNIDIFSKTLQGYWKLKEKGMLGKDILTLVDFSMSSNTKRLWVIDMSTYKVLFHSLVAHGRRSGYEYATSFSNSPRSNKSSLGLYLTGDVYKGTNGLSLRLDGLERGINDSARRRGIVIHSANYVSEWFIQHNKRLGRSQGCPALPPDIAKEIINTIKDKTCLFIYHPSLKTI